MLLQTTGKQSNLEAAAALTTDGFCVGVESWQENRWSVNCAGAANDWEDEDDDSFEEDEDEEDEFFPDDDEDDFDDDDDDDVEEDDE
jgi:hypothetical protein